MADPMFDRWVRFIDQFTEDLHSNIFTFEEARSIFEKCNDASDSKWDWYRKFANELGPFILDEAERTVQSVVFNFKCKIE